MLDVAGLKVQYGDTVIVPCFDLVIGNGECVALMGPSGSGKSSIIDRITGIEETTSGEVFVGGEPLHEMNKTERAIVRKNRMGIAYQTPDLLPELNLAENVAITLLFDGVARDVALERAELSLAKVGLLDKASCPVGQLSGGEAQRGALARAIVRDTMCLLIADEPTASLDPKNALHIAELIIKLVKDSSMGSLIATHDVRVAQLCDRVVHLGEG